ncbi:MAG TPA: hypothetical protein VJ246_00375 [Patescibacteria group bacterium]|nr:hypothetical protein [Patescibacteria group bacterium]
MADTPVQPSTPLMQPLQSNDQVQAADASVVTGVIQSAQSYDPLNPPHPVGKSGLGVKETTARGAVAEVSSQEVPGIQVVETEKVPEISPEVESWIEKVEQHELQLPQEIVVADQTAQQPTGIYAAKPVMILPADQKTVQKGMKKSVTESVRWLAEWCFKIIKKFHGAVVYREEQSTT